MSNFETGRPTPYDLAFADTEFDTGGFDRITAELSASGSLHDPARFMMSQTVSGMLRDFLAESPGASVPAFGPLLYHAWEFRLFGKKVLRLDEPTLRDILHMPEAIGAWNIMPPSQAGYLQLPRNLVWSRIDPAAQAEPVDGIFWAMPAGRQELDALVILGMVPGRPGFSTIRVSGTASAEPSGHWGDVTAREDGNDFANVLPGGEYQQLYALVTQGEVLKLLSRVFYVAATETGRIHLEPGDG